MQSSTTPSLQVFSVIIMILDPPHDTLQLQLTINYHPTIHQFWIYILTTANGESTRHEDYKTSPVGGLRLGCVVAGIVQKHADSFPTRFSLQMWVEPSISLLSTPVPQVPSPTRFPTVTSSSTTTATCFQVFVFVLYDSKWGRWRKLRWYTLDFMGSFIRC